MTLAVAGAYAQQTANTGTLAGNVTDPAGSIVAGAKITAVNADTGFTSEGQTNETGRFSVPYLNPGKYELRVEASGFRRYTGPASSSGPVSRPVSTWRWN